MISRIRSSEFDSIAWESLFDINLEKEELLFTAQQFPIYYLVMNKNSNLREPGNPVGIENCGNTCFMNSLLQFYFMVPPLVRMVFQATTESSDPSSLFLKNLQILFAELLGSAKKAINPRPLFESLEKAAGTSFKFGSQEDIGEFHMIFVETLKKSLKNSGSMGNVEISLRKLFSGKNNEIVVVEKDGKRNEISNLSSKFLSILIGNKEENLVAEWQNTIFSDITGLLRESLYQVDAQQEIWVEKLPEVLFFQIKRVYYIEGFDETYKDCTGIKVPKDLYADRMLLKNKEVTLKIRNECLELNQRKKELLESLHVYKPDSRNALIESIKTLKTFVKTREGIEFSEEVSKSLAYFEALESHINQKINEIQQEIENIDSQIISKYESMRDHRFTLHSILIHDGSSGFGHYFALIKDLSQDIWRMYNDSIIRTIEESEVFDMVQGKKEGKTAYCLVYVNPDTILQSSTGLPLLVFQPGLFDQGFECEYQCYIQNDSILNEINRKNIQIFEESKIEESLGTLIMFQKTYQRINSSLYNGVSPYFEEIQNFPQFLRSKNRRQLMIYAIFDFSSMTHFGSRYKDLDNSIKKAIVSTCKHPSFYELVSREYQEYEEFSLFFKETLKNYHISALIIELIVESKYNPATRIFCCCIHTAEMNNQSVYDLLNNCMKYVLFSLVKDLITTAKGKNLTGLTDICDSIHLLMYVFKNNSFSSGLDMVLTQIEKKFLNGFNKEKESAAQCFAKIKDKSFNLDPFYEKVVQDLNTFNEKFSKINIITYEDLGSTYRRIHDPHQRLNSKFSKWKSFIERGMNGKKLDIKDFE
jgi:ubiquitin C-terminal hydrolase